ncbi:MAG: hypothetical protein M1838_004922 [Thelocarpon superellum]|nr:MAG: hypothetical protein M1838_004922 [Thelocarpon superellum]
MTSHIHHRSSLNPEFSSAMAYLLEVIDFLERSARSGDQESTVIFFPPSTPTGNSRDPSYGDLTQLHTPQKSKRQNQSPEEPLEPQPTPTPSTRPHSNGTVPPPPPMLPSPGSFIPVCHASHEACETATGACFGHGSCEKKYETTGEDGRSHRACFACACKPSLVETGGSGGKGRKTIHWGGAACQKKDVSSPFFLLAGLTVLLIAVISWGIGLLFSVGQEDLPSVIGAGVSGPKAR